jgi:hypothetical protein
LPLAKRARGEGRSVASDWRRDGGEGGPPTPKAPAPSPEAIPAEARDVFRRARRRMAERVGFVPEVPAPLNELGPIETARTRQIL